MKRPIDAETRARADFANHVQSVAFQISLSRAMIAELHIIRDFGYPSPIKNNRELDDKFWNKRERWERLYPREMAHFMTHRPALQRRGLAYPRDDAADGEPMWVLTHAGELMCELLVEAGLMPARQQGKKTA